MAILAGVFVWLLDAMLDSLFFFEGSFGELFITDIPSHELYFRLLMLAAFIMFGVIVSRMYASRAHSEQELLKSRNQLDITLKSIGDAVISTDNAGNVVFMNAVAEKLTGYSLEEALNRPITDVFNIVNEKSGEPVESPTIRVLREGRIVGLANHTILISKSGKRYPIDDSGAPILDKTGELNGTVLVFHDISERREHERKINHLNEILKAIRNVNQLITMEKDPGRLMEESVKCLIETRGYNSAFIILFDEEGNPGLSVQAGLDGKFEKVMESTKSGNPPFCVAETMKRAELVVIRDVDDVCEACPVSDCFHRAGALCSPLSHGDKEFGILVVSIRESLITDAEEIDLFKELAGDLGFALHSIEEERKHHEAEKKVREREQLLQTVMDHSHALIFVKDKEGRLLLVNRRLEEIAGKDKSEMIGRTNHELFPKDSADKFWENDKKVIESNRIMEFEETLSHEEGSRTFLSIKAPISDIGLPGAAVVGIAADVTDLKDKQHQLSRSRDELDSILSSISDGFFVLDQDMKVDYFNEAAEKLLNKKKEEVLGKNLFDSFPEARASVFEENYKKALKEQISLSFEIFFDKEPYVDWYDVRVYPRNGGISVFFQITTGRKKAEETLRYHADLLDRINDAVISTDLQYIIKSWNMAAERIYGLKAEEVIGRSYRDVINTEFHNGSKEEVIESLIREGQWAGDVVQYGCDGRPIHIHSHGVVIKDNQGKPIGMVVVNRDITKRKRAEKELESEREKFRITLRSIGDAVISTDKKGTVVMMNETAEELTGWRESQAVGRNLSEVFNVIDEKTRKPKRSPVDHVVKNGIMASMGMQTVLISKDERERIISDSAAPIRDTEGNITGVVLVFRDYTETRRLQEFASRAQRLETAGRIAGQVAHDFNNLLGPLTAYPALIKEDITPEHPSYDLVDQIERASKQMADINQQLLTLGRRGHYTQKPLNINAIIKQVLGQFYHFSEAVTIETSLSSGLLNIRGGSAQIYRVIANLVSNAFDAMMNVGKLTVKTENFYVDKISGKYGRVPRGEYVKVTVSDTGSGIPPEILPKIFDPFFTTKSAEGVRGSGLGLSVVHSVIEDHGGYIDCESVYGKGTSFYLYFPITRETVDLETTDQISGGKERVLIVDDDSGQREVSRILLTKLGYTADSAVSGEEALNMLKKNKYDIMVLDMIMPGGIDGTDTYERALEIDPDIKAVLVSGYAENKRVEEAIHLGAGMFLRKPVTLRTLGSAVRKILDSPKQPARRHQSK